MRKLTENELNLLRSCSAGKMTNEELLQQFAFRATFEETKYYLDESLKERKNHDFEAIFWNLPNIMSKAEDNILYREFLLKDGHYEHENIVTALQTYFNDDKHNIETLINALKKPPSYLAEDDMKYPYINKCIYAIGTQPEPYNILALEELSGSGDVQIRDFALHQIEKRKRIGRLEAKKNDK